MESGCCSSASGTVEKVTPLASITNTPPEPITRNRCRSTTTAVSSSIPTPSDLGFWATAAISRPIRPRSAKCWSMTMSLTSPNPGAILIASPAFGDDPLSPLTSMVSHRTDAPADVPATTPPPA